MSEIVDLVERGPISRAEIQKSLSWSEEEVGRALAACLREGRIRYDWLARIVSSAAPRYLAAAAPPPLEIGSNAAELLLRVWSGARLTIHPKLHAPSRDERAAMYDVATVASHLSARAGYTVVVLGDGARLELLLRALLTMLPPASLTWYPGMLDPDFESEVEGLGGGSWAHGGVNFVRNGMLDLVYSTAVDVLIDSDGSATRTALDFVGNLHRCRQMVVVGRRDEWMDLDPRTDVEVPLDVQLAGGLSR